ncbi:MAG TPA: competence/damage-inducible protein A [Gammaproteobacteria bacterium]|nr:competence/damage-inducible protein A [Gammaproteobacteria bacterium]
MNNPITHKIALLATGDEISNGDILNTNSQEIAHRLFKHSMRVGNHIVTSDAIADIEQAILFLLTSHNALIITGGLGPTSDDLTRYALSNAVNRSLIFDGPTWEEIVTRLKRFGYDNPPLSNQQQALFPEGANIIANTNGTAAGCMLEQENKYIFMLPGPPFECLPMFEQAVLPALKKAGFSELEYHQSWLLFGVSEGQIAEELDALVKPYGTCMTGYRLFYPYVEFKIHTYNKSDFEKLIPRIEKTIHPYILNDGQKTASEILRTQLEKLNFTLKICDLATGGLLESILKTPQTYSQLSFVCHAETVHVTIRGLDEFWNGSDSTQTTLIIDFNWDNKQETIESIIPFRGYRVKQYAVEFVCWKILKNIKKYEKTAPH